LLSHCQFGGHRTAYIDAAAGTIYVFRTHIDARNVLLEWAERAHDAPPREFAQRIGSREVQVANVDLHFALSESLFFASSPKSAA
jgi:hypothetical protein